MGSSCPRLTATEAILDTVKKSGNIEVDRLISDRTTHELKQDIEKAVLGLKEQYLTNESKSIESKAVDFAINKITSHNAGFTHKELVTEALTYALQNELKPGAQITHEAIMNTIEQKRASGDLVMGKHFSDGTRWTTKEHLDLEHSIVEKIKGGKDKVNPLLDSKATANLLDKVSSKNNLNLTQDQKNACNLITTTKDRFVMVQGYAGTGKTTLFRSVRDVLNERVEVNKHEIASSKGEMATNLHAEATTIFALAPTHRAVKELKTLGIEAQTLKSFLVEYNKEIKKDGSINRFDKTLFILDEASMISNKDFEDFLKVIDEANCRVVLSGDIAQHISVESGKPFEIIQKSNIVDTAYLKEIIRQKNPIIKSAVEDVISGDYKEAFNKIDKASSRGDIERTKESSFLASIQNSIVERDNNKLKSKDKTLEALVADDFLTRTKQVRDNTVVIVHANKDRKIINEHIREGLKKEGVVSKNGLNLDCLISKNLTGAEHQLLSSYKTGDVIKLAKNYYRVAEIDYDSKSLLLKDEKNNSKLFYPDKYSKKYNYGVYEKTKAELAVGDSIRLTKTDKERSLYANFKYEVVGLNEDKITLRKANIDSKETDSAIILNSKELSDAHWDYAYTVTGYGIQGGSKPYIIDFEPSYRKNLANQRSFYIAVSRAIKHLTIYTDDKAKLLQRITVNKGDKLSSLEVSGEVKTNNDLRPAAKKDKQNVVKTNKNNETRHKDYEHYDAKVIEKLLNNQAEFFVERVLGSPNQKLSSQSEWRYGNKGSLVVSMSGEKRGLWYNFETGESGNLLTLFQKETGLPFKDTLKYVSNMLGNIHQLSDTNHAKNSSYTETQKSNLSEKEHANNTSKYANKLFKESTPITGTIVEKYLKNIRGICNIDAVDLRYHSGVYVGKNTKSNDTYAPAMLAIGRDKDNRLQCVQATYLDHKTAGKANLDVKKRTYSSPSGASVSLNNADSFMQNRQKNEKGTTYIAEGIETGLSIKDAVKDANVLVTLGKSNFATIDLDKLTNKVMFCLDNDGTQTFKDPIIQKAIQRLVDNGKEVFVSMPEQINNRKTDFNDTLKFKGIDAIKHQINNAVPHDQFAKNQLSIASIQDGLSKNIQQIGGNHDHVIVQSTGKSNAEHSINKNHIAVNNEIKITQIKSLEMEI